MPFYHALQQPSRLFFYLVIQMTADNVSIAHIFWLWRFCLTFLHTFTASCMEFTSLRRIRRRWNTSFQNNTISLQVWIWHRNCAEQCLCIRMKRIRENIFCLSRLHQTSQIHNANRIRNMLYNRKVMRDK